MSELDEVFGGVKERYAQYAEDVREEDLERLVDAVVAGGMGVLNSRETLPGRRRIAGELLALLGMPGYDEAHAGTRRDALNAATKLLRDCSGDVAGVQEAMAFLDGQKGGDPRYRLRLEGDATRLGMTPYGICFDLRRAYEQTRKNACRSDGFAAEFRSEFA